MEEILAATLRLGAPLLLAALGELIVERSGVVNIGIEGMMLVGAFVAFAAAVATGSPAVGVGALAFSGDGRFLATKNDCQPTTVWVWSAISLELCACLQQLRPVTSFGWDPTAHRLAVATGEDGLPGLVYTAALRATSNGEDPVELLDPTPAALLDLDFRSWIREREEAFARAREGAFDVVLTDLNMPGLNGIDLCARLVANRPDVPVVVMTAFGSLETAVAAIRAGAYDFVTKPFAVDHLVVVIDRAMRHHELQEKVRVLREELERVAQGDPPVQLELFLAAADKPEDVAWAELLLLRSDSDDAHQALRNHLRRGERLGLDSETLLETLKEVGPGSDAARAVLGERHAMLDILLRDAPELTRFALRHGGDQLQWLLGGEDWSKVVSAQAVGQGRA